MADVPSTSTSRAGGHTGTDALGGWNPSTPGARGRAVWLGLTSAAMGLGSLAPVPAGIRYSLELGASAPLVLASPADAWVVGGVQAALVGGSFALRQESAAHAPVSPYWMTAELFSVHQAIYAAYATYRAARSSGSSEAWNDSWRPWTADELMVAPVTPKNINHTVVAASLSVEAAVLGLGTAGFYGRGGRTRADLALQQIGLYTAISWDAGVTEEALFRGFLYEELKLSMPRWAARAMDMTLFTLAHVPGEMGQKAELVATGLATRAVCALLFEIAYDEGGLPESVALHALWDTVVSIVAGLTNIQPIGGNIIVPQGHGVDPTKGAASLAFVPRLTLSF